MILPEIIFSCLLFPFDDFQCNTGAWSGKSKGNSDEKKYFNKRVIDGFSALVDGAHRAQPGISTV